MTVGSFIAFDPGVRRQDSHCDSHNVKHHTNSCQYLRFHSSQNGKNSKKTDIERGKSDKNANVGLDPVLGESEFVFCVALQLCVHPEKRERTRHRRGPCEVGNVHLRHKHIECFLSHIIHHREDLRVTHVFCERGIPGPVESARAAVRHCAWHVHAKFEPCGKSMSHPLCALAGMCVAAFFLVPKKAPCRDHENYFTGHVPPMRYGKT